MIAQNKIMQRHSRPERSSHGGGEGEALSGRRQTRSSIFKRREGSRLKSRERILRKEEKMEAKNTRRKSWRERESLYSKDFSSLEGGGTKRALIKVKGRFFSIIRGRKDSCVLCEGKTMRGT